MTHLDTFLSDRVALGAIWSIDFGTQVVETDSGHEVRNNRHAQAKRVLEIPYPLLANDDALLDDIVALYEAAGGMLRSFNVRDWRDQTGGTVIAMRFDTALAITAVASHLQQVGTLICREVFA